MQATQIDDISLQKPGGLGQVFTVEGLKRKNDEQHKSLNPTDHYAQASRVTHSEG